jgi:integrase
MSKQDTNLRETVDAFLSSKRCRNANTRRSYGAALDKLVDALGPERRSADVFDDELDSAFTELWSEAAPAGWNLRRAAVKSWSDWCRRNQYHVPSLTPGLERQTETVDETKALPRAAIERQLTRRDVPLREKTLWRLLYESAARAEEILQLNIEDLDLDARRGRVTSKGGAQEWIYWSSGTAHLLPRLLRGRTSGPVFIADRRPVPARRPPARDICPTTGRGRLSYDRARVLFDEYTGWDLHQLRHSALTHLGEQGTSLGLLMAKSRHRNVRTAMRYVKPGADAVATVTELLDLAPPRRG